MIIISIDVGIRNLAYIIIEVVELNKHHILEWDVLELCDKNVKASCVDNVIIGNNMKNLMNEKYKDYQFDKIIIENQIGQNAIKMKTIQGMINMYFIMKGYDHSKIINYNAVHKLKPFIEKGKKTTYAERKKMSKQITEKLCEKYYGSSILEYYKNFKKKDDLADCLLQGLDYIKKQELNDDSFYLFIK
jgi:hypothetical protein